LERAPADVYTEHLHQRELAYQVDDDGRAVFRPRVGPTRWRVSAGRGTVYSTTVVRPRGGEAYNIVLVDLDEGFRMMSTVVGVAPEAVAIGARVVLAWREGEREGEGGDAAAPPVPVFTPAPAEAGSSAEAGAPA
jgi:uncharacterized protein